MNFILSEAKDLARSPARLDDGTRQVGNDQPVDVGGRLFIG